MYSFIQPCSTATSSAPGPAASPSLVQLPPSYRTTIPHSVNTIFVARDADCPSYLRYAEPIGRGPLGTLPPAFSGALSQRPLVPLRATTSEDWPGDSRDDIEVDSTITPPASPGSRTTPKEAGEVPVLSPLPLSLGARPIAPFPKRRSRLLAPVSASDSRIASESLLALASQRITATPPHAQRENTIPIVPKQPSRHVYPQPDTSSTFLGSPLGTGDSTIDDHSGTETELSSSLASDMRERTAEHGPSEIFLAALTPNGELAGAPWPVSHDSSFLCCDSDTQGSLSRKRRPRDLYPVTARRYKARSSVLPPVGEPPIRSATAGSSAPEIATIGEAGPSRSLLPETQTAAELLTGDPPAGRHTWRPRRPQVCQVEGCEGMSFEWPSTLQAHLEVVHGIKTTLWKCEGCGMETLHQNSLRTHQKFSCPVLSRDYSSSDSDCESDGSQFESGSAESEWSGSESGSSESW